MLLSMVMLNAGVSHLYCVFNFSVLNPAGRQ